MARKTGPSHAVARLVIERDDRCLWCGRGVYNGAVQVHHRRPRGAGGTRRGDANSLANLVALHPGCHADIESHRDEARRRGFLVPLASDPLMHPVRDHVGRWWFLLPDGRRQESTDPEF